MLETSESILSADHETVKLKITIAVLHQCQRQEKWITTHAIRCLVQCIYSPNITYFIAPKSQNSKIMPNNLAKSAFTFKPAIALCAKTSRSSFFAWNNGKDRENYMTSLYL